MDDLRALLLHAAGVAADHLENRDLLPVFPTDRALADARVALGSLDDRGVDAAVAVDQLAAAVSPALVASTGGRYFGFVIGGALPGALGADVLTAAWDQNAYNRLSSPVAAVVEDVAGEWLKELLGLPTAASFGFVTGAQAANTVAIAAARHHVLAQAGWDVERHGLLGGPRVRVVATGERHATIDRALRFLGLGADSLEAVATDGQGRVDVDDLRRVLSAGQPGPLIVCLQAGNVNTGSFDDFAAAIPVAHAHGAWVHVDGAFGLWAGANPSTSHLTAGVEAADSWGTDGHKWLNVPYDAGYAFCAHPDAHRASMAYTAAYLGPQDVDRSPGDYVLESSRRARGFATWAALRQLGRSGVAEMVDRSCRLARRFEAALSGVEGVEVVNDVVLNQVMVRFGGDDAVTDAVIARVQQSGECWMGGTMWQGLRLMRISVSGHATTDDDVDRSIEALLVAFRQVT
jgi:glutamate/tyrosine decarboxylase-like PLP-dependent enzyme